VRIDRTLILIRERSFLDLLDLALLVVRRRPRVLATTALVGIGPWAILNVFLTRGLGDARGFYNILLILLEAPLATAPLTIVLGGMMFGRRPGGREVARTLFENGPGLILYQVILRGIVLATLVLTPLLPTRMAFVNEVLLLERGSMWKVLNRSSLLSMARGSELLLYWMVQVAFGALFVVCFWFAVGNVREVLIGRFPWIEPPWDTLVGARTIGATWAVVWFLGLVRFLLYIDQRIRLEGWEVELRLKAVAASLRREMEE
jgi:hypothetical protein